MVAALFLDDDHELSALCKAFPEGRGEFKVDAVATMKGALQATADAPYDAIISDHRLLRDQDGRPASRRCKRCGQGPGRLARPAFEPS